LKKRVHYDKKGFIAGIIVLLIVLVISYWVKDRAYVYYISESFGLIAIALSLGLLIDSSISLYHNLIKTALPIQSWIVLFFINIEDSLYYYS